MSIKYYIITVVLSTHVWWCFFLLQNQYFRVLMFFSLNLTNSCLDLICMGKIQPINKNPPTKQQLSSTNEEGLAQNAAELMHKLQKSGATSNCMEDGKYEFCINNSHNSGIHQAIYTSKRGCPFPILNQIISQILFASMLTDFKVCLQTLR